MPYVWKADMPVSEIELLASPVMIRPRYNNQPVYYSDVVVHKESPFFKFADLRGARWIINEARSHSGFNLVRYYLSTIGETFGFFGEVIESGAHQDSLRLIIDGRSDASAIDSTVLETEFEKDPELNRLLRVIETFGPSPIPPFVASKTLPRELREKLSTLLLNLHKDSEGRELLARARFARFTAVQDSDYDQIRRMAQIPASF